MEVALADRSEPTEPVLLQLLQVLQLPLTELELHLAKLLFLNEAAKSLGHDVADVNDNSMSIHCQCYTGYCL